MPENDPEVEAEVIASVFELLYRAKNPIILADCCSMRHRVVEETHKLMEKLEIPGFVTPMGKGAIDETNPHFGGVYIGEISLPNVREVVERSDCVLSIGALLSDFNTVSLLTILLTKQGSFSYHIGKSRTVEFHSTWTQV